MTTVVVETSIKETLCSYHRA